MRRQPGRHRRIRVLVADAQPLYRDALTRAVREWPELDLVAEAEDGRAALDVIAQERPDVAVIDDLLPKLSALQVLNAVLRDGLTTRMLLMTAEPHPALVYRAIGDGAAGYLTKRVDKREICDAIVAVARGKTVLAPELHDGIAGEIRLREVRERPRITNRERDILRLIAEGMSTPIIAQRLFLSPSTVKKHQVRIYDKLRVQERAAAVAEAMRRGLLE